MKFTQIFWDNDGVLVDTEPYYLQTNREALAKLDITSEHEFRGADRILSSVEELPKLLL